MLVIGVDPGYGRVGWGVVEGEAHLVVSRGWGCIETAKESPIPARILEVSRGLNRLLDEWSPDGMALETLYFSKNVTTAMQVAEVRGVIRLAAAEREIPVAEYAPNQIKQAVTGSGRADKRQVQEMVRRILALDVMPRPDDAADALACAVCHVHRTR
ncbi:MAG: crossover junction endodeoxyribonuclease RuvC [Methanospirillum sp.]|nr:crossover junction endodeoxyribonuclease RuvC [Methanospirillum sp.]